MRLRDASLRGMVRSLNSRFSHYFTPRENELFRQATSGEFSGVGMTVVEHPRGLRVAGVFDDSPAKRAGIRPGDVITKVNGRSIAGQPSDVSTARIKGKEGTYVRLTVGAGSAPAQLRVRRERIRVPAVVLEAAPRRRTKLGVSSWRGSPPGARGLVGRSSGASGRGGGVRARPRANGVGCSTRRCWSRARSYLTGRS